MHLNTVFYLFLIISLGYILGNFKIRGFSLDISAILIVALIAGHFGITIPEEFKLFGLAIFIYAIGLQSGPGFFDTLKNYGIKLNFLAFMMLSIILLTVYIAGKFFGYNASVISGIYTGAMASAPALASVLEVKNDPVVSIMFGVVYPFGIIVAVLFIRFISIYTKIDFQKEIENFESEEKKLHPPIITKNFRITNEYFKNNEVLKSKVQEMTSTVIERVESDHDLELMTEDYQLHYNDIVRVTGTEKELEKVKILLGEEVEESFTFHDNLKSMKLLVTSKDIVGKKISTLKELNALGVVISKIRRSGVDITPMPSMTLLLGDKLYVVAPEKNKEAIIKLIGDNLLQYPAADFLPISIGIVIGTLVGMIPISFPVIGSMNISFVGGILITALILGRLGRTGPFVWQLSPHSTTLMKTLGQLIFMATIGTNAGQFLVESLQQQGFMPIAIGVSAIILALGITGHIAYRFMKLNFLSVLGLLSGGMTSTPSLTMSNNIAKSDIPSISYAAVYPFSLILTLLFAQLIIKIGG
jgi:putative transport protein